MKRTPVNPWSWSLNFGFNQAEIIEGHRRELICAGQTAGRRHSADDAPGVTRLFLPELMIELEATAVD